MISSVTIIISVLTILLGRVLFGRWFNHLLLYVLVWAPIILLFELKLIRYQEIQSFAWWLILLAFVSFVLGTLTGYSARALKEYSENNIAHSQNFWLSDNQNLLKFLILFFGIIGLLTVVQNWIVLLNEFGSIQRVLLNASLVYRMRIERTIEGQIPYLFTFSYVSLFFAAIYSAIRNKISILVIIPFLGVILKEISQSSRAGILNAFFLFLSAFLIFRYFYQFKKKIKFSNRKLVTGFIFVAILLYLSTTLIRVTRITNEKFKGATTELNELESNAIISPSLYLYFSGQIGTFNKVISYEERSQLFAEKTLTMLYGTISKFDLVKRPKDHDKGYFIPVWINTGTFLREIFMDYGYYGIIIVPFFLGLLCTIYWFKFFETGSLFSLTILSHLYVIVGFSFVIFVVRLSTWVFPIVILIISTYLLENKNLKLFFAKRFDKK